MSFHLVRQQSVCSGSLSPAGTSIAHQFEQASSTGTMKKVKRISIPARYVAPSVKSHAPNNDESPQKVILETMESSHNAVRNLQNAAALLQFSVYIEQVGPEKALQMLAGLSKL
jgi:hypothetical protein